MNKKTEVIICLGSSCFARGNKNLLKVINKFIQDNNLKEKVYFHGGHCFGSCAEGPILKVDDTIYCGVDEAKAFEILIEAFDV